MFNIAVDHQEWSALEENQPADWVVIDIETGNAPEEAITRKMEEWKPAGNISKPETIAAKREEAKQKIRQKSALLDEAPILCIAIIKNERRMVFNSMDSAQHDIEGWCVKSLGSEQNMLIAFRDWLDAHTSPYTTLVGHNLRGFDLPKIRSAYIRHRLRLPQCMKVSIGIEIAKQPTADTMAIYAYKFAVESNGQPFVSLDKMASALGVPRPKTVISGSDVPAMHERGEHIAILTYCAIDTSTTARCFELMSSESPDLQ